MQKTLFIISNKLPTCDTSKSRHPQSPLQEKVRREQLKTDGSVEGNVNQNSSIKLFSTLINLKLLGLAWFFHTKE